MTEQDPNAPRPGDQPGPNEPNEPQQPGQEGDEPAEEGEQEPAPRWRR